MLARDITGFVVEWTTTEGKIYCQEFALAEQYDAILLASQKQNQLRETRERGGPGLTDARCYVLTGRPPRTETQQRWEMVV